MTRYAGLLIGVGCCLWLILSHPRVAKANIPAAYLACEGAEEGSACSLPGPQFGVCVRDSLCEDLEETSVNECVLCVDGCWAGRDGEACIRPWSGEMGICCTDPPETSFEECRRCVLPLDSRVNVDEHDSAEVNTRGCIQPHGSDRYSMLVLIWSIVLICLAFKRLRSKCIS